MDFKGPYKPSSSVYLELCFKWILRAKKIFFTIIAVSVYFRLQEQEEELKRVRTYLSKKAEESGEADKSVW